MPQELAIVILARRSVIKIFTNKKQINYGRTLTLPYCNFTSNLYTSVETPFTSIETEDFVRHYEAIEICQHIIMMILSSKLLNFAGGVNNCPVYSGLA